MNNFNLEQHGLQIYQNFLSPAMRKEIVSEFEQFTLEHNNYALRNAEKKLSSVQQLVHSTKLINHARKLLLASPQLVRVILFDKTPSNNWLVTWHQDKTIAVNKRIVIADWGPWSLKDGVNHVQPSLDVLQQMVTFRIHLDPANEANGCLKVIPASQKLGLLTQSEITQIVKHQTKRVYLCEAKAGDLLVMRPHLLHASSKATKPNHRRVLHIEYSSFTLPEQLSWL